MEAFDPIRRDASELHDRLITAGVDALDPMALAVAALDGLGIDLAWLPPDDPALKGAKALFDEQSGTICCAAVGDAAARALLLAHEIGHVVVHAGSSTCSDSDIDPTRSTEAAPVGLQRVEDYGAHERRELQANVFAREFLLPRSLAHRLHVNDCLTASAIGERTGLPKALVRQQLFDALLLPPPEAPAAVAEPAYIPCPDPSQDRAAAHRGSAFQLQAGPGTGKTRTLIKRVQSLLAEGVDPASILILTFSNRAAGELAERLAIAAPEQAPRIWVGTFHAFGLDLVRRHHDRLGLSPNPSLFDRSDAIEVLEEILPTLPLVHYQNLWDPALQLREIVLAISRAKDELVDPVRYRALANAMLTAASDEEATKAAEKCLEVAHVYDLYEQALRGRKAVDFGDLIMRPAVLLETDEALRVAIQLRHRHLLVDEYQDVNRASARLLKAVAGNGKRLWVVGDSRQSIYRFRGASSANMAQFGQDYPGATVDQLTVNYRSTQQIVDAFAAAAPQMSASQGMLPLNLVADRGQGPAKLDIRRYDRLEDEEAGIAAAIRQLETAGVLLRDQAVLCRSNKRLNEIAAALEARDIPVLHLGSLFEREEVRDLLALLSLVIDPFGDGLARVGAMPRYDLSLQDVHVASQYVRGTGNPVLAVLPTLAEANGLSANGQEAFRQMATDFADIRPEVSAWEFLSTYMLDRTSLARDIGAATTITGRMRAVAVWQFLNFVREQGVVVFGLPIQRTLDRVRQLVLLAEERDLRQVPAAALHLNAVRLMTVHGSKGLEFEAVHIPGLTAASFPASNRGQRCPPPVGMIEGSGNRSVKDEAASAHEQEEQCLFFVALSRARTHLRLHLSRKQPNGNNRAASSFLNWLSGGVAVEIATPPTIPLPAGALQSPLIAVTRGSGWSITDGRLSLYDKCPRRFFYTHVLGLGGARKQTAFTQTHACLHDLIRWLREAARAGPPSQAEAEAEFDAIWQAKGPVEHAYAADYRRLALRLVAALIRAGANRTFRETTPMAVDFPNGQVLVEPSDVAELADGTVVVRRVRTGYKRTDEYDKLEYALYLLAARGLSGDVVVHALHLTCETAEPVTLSPTKLANRQTKSDAMLAGIRDGRFPPEIDAVTCPRCPHFFVCAATPSGPLHLP